MGWLFRLFGDEFAIEGNAATHVDRGGEKNAFKFNLNNASTPTTADLTISGNLK